jgi:hypothetical protein
MAPSPIATSVISKHRTEMEAGSMKYALLLYADEAAWEALDPAAQGEAMAQYDTTTEDMKRAGAYIGGEALSSTSTATTLRLRDGKPLVTDGPFVESKEVLGGFYVVECASLNEALDWAARIPDARLGGVEVRPLLDIEALRAEATDAAADR